MYKPTEGMASAAKRALKWHEEGKPGGTLVGLARANQLKNREELSASTVLRMYSFLRTEMLLLEMLVFQMLLTN